MSSSPPPAEDPVVKKRKRNPGPNKEKSEGANKKGPKNMIPICEAELNGADKLMMAMKNEGKPIKDIVKALSDLTGKPINKNTVASRCNRLAANLKVWPEDHTAKLLQIKKDIEENLEKSKMTMIATALKEQTNATYTAEAIIRKCRQLERDGMSAPTTAPPVIPATPKATTKKVTTPKKASAKKSTVSKKSARTPTPTLTNPDISDDEDDVDGEGVDDEEANRDKGEGDGEMKEEGDGEIEEGDAEIKAEGANHQSEGEEDMDEIENFLEPEGPKGFEV